MKTLALVGRILLLILSVALLLLVVGTMATVLPFFGSVGGYIVLGGEHLFALGVLVLTLTVAVLMICRHKVLHFVTMAVLIATLVLTFVCTGQVTAALRAAGADVRVWHKVATPNVQVEEQVYTTSDSGDVPLTIYYCAEADAPKPVIIYIHGGGWTGGSMHDHTYYSRVYATEGYVACSLSYDLSTPERHLVDTTEQQLAEAFAWIALHIADYGGDPARLYLTGDSAGGNLALEMAYKINGGVYTHAADGTPLPTVTAVAVTYPVADPALFWANPDLVLGAPSRTMCESYTGTTPDADPAAYAAITPGNYVTPNAPRTLLIVAEADTMVPPQGSYDLAATLNTAGVANRLVRLPYLNHGFDTMDGSLGSQGVLALTLNWFDENAQ